MTAIRTISIRIPVGSPLDEHISRVAITAGSQSGAVIRLLERTQKDADSVDAIKDYRADLQQEIDSMRDAKNRYERLSGELILFMAAQIEQSGGIDEQ